METLSWLKRASFWYEVTFGLYAMETWERMLANVNILVMISAVMYLLWKQVVIMKLVWISGVLFVFVLGVALRRVWMFIMPPRLVSAHHVSLPNPSLATRNNLVALSNPGRVFLFANKAQQQRCHSLNCSIPRPSSNRFFFASFRVKAVANPPAEVETGFDQMVAGTKRKYFMLGGKGGVGKTSLAASLAVKFANSGHTTLVVSTDPAHSLSDSFAQELSGGKLVAVEGPDSPLFALEINPEQARAEFRAATQKEGGGSGVKDFMDSFGLGAWVEQLSELKLGELLDTPPPGLDEAIAISKVVQFMQSPEYDRFTRIIFDTAPTGHTLRLLSLPDFLESSIGKLLKLKQKLSSATAAIKSVFGQGDGTDTATDKLEMLKERMVMVREIFRNKEATEFVIVTIPTVMAVSESSRLRQSLQKEGVPVKRLIVNQVLPASKTDCKFCSMRRKDQARAFDIINSDQNLKDLQLIQSPLMDVEIRGVPALRFVGDTVWR